MNKLAFWEVPSLELPESVKVPPLGGFGLDDVPMLRGFRADVAVLVDLALVGSLASAVGGGLTGSAIDGADLVDRNGQRAENGMLQYDVPTVLVAEVTSRRSPLSSSTGSPYAKPMPIMQHTVAMAMHSGLCLRFGSV